MPKGFWDAKTPIAIAHRGGDGAGENQENTLKAFKAAQNLGYKYAETDVILAASGEVVVIHGSRNLLQSALKRDISRPSLQRMTLAEIRKTFNLFGVKVATLDELLTELPKMKFLIDPKTDEVVLPLAKIILKLNASDRVCVGSFNLDRINQFKRVTGNTNVSTSLIIGRGLRLVNKNLLMLKSGRLKQIEAIQLHHSLVSREMIDLVHNQGFKALIWTCNSGLSIKNAITSGADGIESDNIKLLKEALEEI